MRTPHDSSIKQPTNDEQPCCTRWIRTAAIAAAVAIAAGCGSKPAATGAAATSVDDSKDGGGAAKPAEQQAAKPASEAAKPSAESIKAAIAKSVAATPKPRTIQSWELADLQNAITQKDVQYLPGVTFFAMRSPADAKRGAELDGLVKAVAKLPDDTGPVGAALPPPPPPRIKPVKPGMLPAGMASAPGSPAAGAANTTAADDDSKVEKRGRKRKKD